ncbi:MAG: bifunctional adenosylcobinamide kinase/adenosylcobinamide-phosphate guanylyltransferase [Verrucomicrobia bacterium]|nr:bifunctional adenosylcobinamide kinase/adenosylcobinamide-phosphate guanylyltransferase [Verrucomicrobiota bacterium]
MPNRLKANKSRVPKIVRRPLVRLLILGGARSGKSRLAQDIAVRRWQRPVYLATAEILDDEMAARVRMHRRARALKLSDPGYAEARAHTSRRAQRWRCVEEPLEIAKIIRRGVPGTDGILVDCLTIWLSNVLLKEGRGAFARRRDELVKALHQARQDVILVANEVGMGVVPEYALGRTFRDLAGWLNQSMAKEADTVVFVAAGLPLVLKGRLPE